jgi:hypothetical protein
VFAALDLFLHNPRLLPPATATRPADGTPIFNYLVKRLAIILNGPKVIQWIQLPAHDVEIEIRAGDITSDGRYGMAEDQS